ncbi:malto-oligosyltrehalose trehalohydrolase [Rhodococcus sp. MTM3W5.2]|nr:malto-oligosyltrehalose trehalohydrolase [Rhodococcus sp. MTM3W5.2]
MDLGVGFVELMPVNGFNGEHNWGYDGVLWYTTHEPYGGPDGLQRFVDACHGRGLGVILDVVYNHLGPSGNYLDRYGPYLADTENPWGAAVNIAGPFSGEVRRYIIDNALRWLREFHIDGLRLDAVHALVDLTATHLLEDLSVETETLSTHLRRPLTLIAESDLNDPALIAPRSAGGHGLDAQWNDDIHHAVHAAVSGERQGYYGDFGSIQCLATTLRQGFFHAGPIPVSGAVPTAGRSMCGSHPPAHCSRTPVRTTRWATARPVIVRGAT